ncbi:hypothetical protein [Xanthobacter agilis]|uniref:Roadblock/LAMTOR2 domain-containing protein n=1 Tax=Xanthobacter agilis TaxID=47492 RepID=A0ABU0LK08_XANAG|nr:hypothetical protein [Xanthobacter agilis]MDQ0507418.1 hypothetical protein [Xanthobacter agilis]
MTQVSAVSVSGVLGHMNSDDGQHALIGFQEAEGAEFALAIPHALLLQVISSMIAASAVQETPEGGGIVAVEALKTNRFYVNETTTGALLRFWLSGGGVIPLEISKDVAQRLVEVLGSVVGVPPTAFASRTDTPQ